MISIREVIKTTGRKETTKYYIFTQEDLDNDDIISMVETTPTYKRSKAVLESIQSRAVAEESSTPKLDNSENGSMTLLSKQETNYNFITILLWIYSNKSATISKRQ